MTLFLVEGVLLLFKFKKGGSKYNVT
jgi:hypothetical protein